MSLGKYLWQSRCLGDTQSVHQSDQGWTKYSLRATPALGLSKVALELRRDLPPIAVLGPEPQPCTW